MFYKFPLFASLVVFTATPALHAAANMEQEYQQVRKIALRDARVRAAYTEADEKLADKIVQIDPALKDYVKNREAGHAAPAAKAAPHKTKQIPSTGSTHVVTKVETLGAIAKQYKVTVDALKSANHITDERKLRAGQSITIPGVAEKKSPGIWDSFKSKF